VWSFHNGRTAIIVIIVIIITIIRLPFWGALEGLLGRRECRACSLLLMDSNVVLWAGNNEQRAGNAAARAGDVCGEGRGRAGPLPGGGQGLDHECLAGFPFPGEPFSWHNDHYPGLEMCAILMVDSSLNHVGKRVLLVGTCVDTGPPSISVDLFVSQLAYDFQ
jgi:hypothetical protein